MSKPSEAPRMSSIVPRHLAQKAGRFIERRLPLKWWDALNQFWVETRLVFSRAILLLVGALFTVFSWSAIMQGERLKENDVFEMLHFQVLILAILLNMSLWEMEREGRTFELLIMRVPNLHRLIWFKMRVSLFWMTGLAIPFFAAYGWFLSIPFGHLALYFVFIVTFATLTAFATCVAASFVHHGLTSAIVTFILTVIAMSICRNMNFRYFDFFNLFMNPRATLFDKLGPHLTAAETFWVLLANRIFLALVTAGFYVWLLRRLAKTEKWIQ